MRRIFFGTGVLVLGLAMLMWATAPVSAAWRGGGHGGGGHAAAGGGHAAAHVGSVHYGRPARAPWPLPESAPRCGQARSGPSITRARRPGAATAILTGPTISGDFRPGYFPFVLGDAQYYGYYSLPLGYQQVVLNGITYYLFDGVYYQPYIYGGQTVYLVVPNPNFDWEGD